MLKSMTLRSTLAAVACAISFSAHAMADAAKTIEIPAGDLRPALLQLSKTFGLELLYQPSQLAHFHTSGVKGSYTPEAAVRLLLKGTPLELRTDPSGAMMVIDPHAPKSAAVSALSEQPSPGPAGAENSQSRSRLQLAQATPGQASGPASVSGQSSSSQESSKEPTALQEIVVTAEKKRENLLNVPVPVTAISSDVLAESDQPRLIDYFQSVPGLNLTTGFYDIENISFRGIAGESGGDTPGPTTALLIDDIPLTGSGYAAGYVPDIDPSEIAQVEALRGPQGTLYGASSMGGLLKWVTVDPSTQGLSGRVQADVNGIYHGAEAGYTFRGSLNLPITDDLAIRGSAFDRQSPGYIDNPLLGLNGVNEDKAYGGRVSALWRPSDTFKLKLSALYQDTKADSTSDVDEPTPGYPQTTGLGPLQQIYPRGCCGYDRQFEAYTANMTAKLGLVDVTSLTGYSAMSESTALDYSYALGGVVQPLFGVGGIEFRDFEPDYVFTQEVRASMHIGQSLEWLVGAFYEHDASPLSIHFPAVDPSTGAVAGDAGQIFTKETYTQYAAFTNLTIHFTDRFDLQLGARQGYIQGVGEPSVDTGPLFGGTITAPAVEGTNKPFTYLVTPEFKFSPDLMAYVRIASGFRPGIINRITDPTVPRLSAPDKTTNYEIGAKGDFLGHALTLDASVYYIDWKDMQTSLYDAQAFATITANAGQAKSEGVELSMQARPLSGMTVSGWVTYDNAVLTEGFPSTSSLDPYGASGSRLPQASKFSGDVSIAQSFPVRGDVTGDVGGQLSYVGNSLGAFGTIGAPERQVFPGYAKADVHVGLERDLWKVNLYANNLLDKRGLIGGGVGGFPPYAYYYIQPRTIGLSITRDF